MDNKIYELSLMQLLNKIKEDEEEIACSQEFIGKTKNEAAKRFLDEQLHAL